VEQDPFFGRTALHTLTLGKYGIFKIVNRTDPKLTDPFSSMPPQELGIHLAWINGYRGIEAGHASTLQGLAALMLDDWRWALQVLPHVRFFVHRGEQTWFALAGPGSRWHAGLTSGLLPPACFAQAFFTRRSHLEADSKIDWKTERTKSIHLWFVLVLKSDIAEIGFHETEQSTAQWIEHSCRPGSSGAIHVIVVDPVTADGRIYRDRGAYRFQLLRTNPGASKDQMQFGSLRLNCIDAVIGAIEAVT
jgi:hypothetical protein